MRLWNCQHMSNEYINAKWDDGMLHLSHAMHCCHTPWEEARDFMFDHPDRAFLWHQPEVMEIRELLGVACIVIDMCQFGLAALATQLPMRTRTRIMKKSPVRLRHLAGKLCPRQHKPQLVHESEGGIRRSTWAQIYPPGLCDAMIRAALMHVSQG